MSGHRDGGEDSLLGRSLDDRYRIEGRLGRGGMGAVYRGRHLMMDRPVAIKVLRPDLADDQVAVRRFAREAKGTFRFDQPNCVRVFDFGYAADVGVLYLVMELLDGRTVGEELRVDGPMASARVVHIATQVSRALGHAHGLGVVHRDLKPENIMLITRDGDVDFAKVLDFGLAKLFEPDSSGTQIFSVAAITQDGMVFGTPEYMSPEQATGRTLSPASDIYSLGVVMYEMVTGLLPFSGKSFMAVLSKQVRDTPVAPKSRRPELEIPVVLDELIMACLAKAPEERPRNAQELGERLAEAATSAVASTARVPRSVAASETMDLSAQSPRLDAATVEHTEVATAPTIAVDTGPVKGVTDWEKRSRARSRTALALLVPIVAVAAVLAAVIAFSGRSETAVDGGPTGVVLPPADASATAAWPHDAGIANAAADAALADASQTRADATRDAPVEADGAESAAAEKRRRVRARVAAHLRAADSARRAGNALKQVAEADSALRLDRGNKRAAFLLGDALVRSGDKARGCGYLRKARSLKEARSRLAEAGCK